jgi:hypothetical protein
MVAPDFLPQLATGNVKFIVKGKGRYDIGLLGILGVATDLDEVGADDQLLLGIQDVDSDLH